MGIKTKTMFRFFTPNPEISPLYIHFELGALHMSELESN